MDSLPILVPLLGGVFAVFTCITCCTTHNVRREQRLLADRFTQLETQLAALGSRATAVQIPIQPSYTTHPPPIRPALPQVVLQPFSYSAYPYATAPPPPQQQPAPTKFTV